MTPAEKQRVRNTIRARLKLGWSVEVAITTPIGAIKRMQCHKAA